MPSSDNETTAHLLDAFLTRLRAELPSGAGLDSTNADVEGTVLVELARRLVERGLAESAGTPSSDGADDALRELARRFVDAESDLFGPVFESCLAPQDRKRRGEFYTPRPLVQFVLDRVGCTVESLAQAPVVLDLCCGTGGFLVEVARRLKRAFPERPAEVAAAIAERLRGCERSPSAAALARANLLLQLPPGRASEPCILCDNALRLHPTERSLFDMLDDPDPPRELRRLRDDGQADFVVGNPPYVGEKGHQRLFRETLAEFPYWRQHYRGKMDYAYFFLMLGLLKLRPGGRLGYVMASYWLTADGASRLRQFVLDHAKIVELIDFGELRLFPDAPGHHTLVVVLERCDDRTARDAHRPQLIEVRSHDATQRDGTTDLASRLAHVARAEGAGDDSVSIFASPLTQGELSDGAWNLFHERSTEERLQRIAAAGEPLRAVCRDCQGVVSGADRVTPSHLRDWPEAPTGLRTGDGIFVLSEQEVARLALSPDERTLLHRTYKNRQVGWYVVDDAGDEPEFLLYLTRAATFSADATPALFRHLAPFRELLSRKRECRILDVETGRPRREWHELHWPRDAGLPTATKLVTARRAACNRFALAPPDTIENSDLTVLILRPGVREDVRFVLALLNSSLLDFWFAHRSKRKGRLREYYSTPLQQVPIRRIRFDPPTPSERRTAVLDELRAATADGDGSRAAELLGRELATGAEDLVHDGLVQLVDELLALQREVARHSTPPRRWTRLDPRLPNEKLPDRPSAELATLRAAVGVRQTVIDRTVEALYGLVEP